MVIVEVSKREYVYANWLTLSANVHCDHATRDAGLCLRRFFLSRVSKVPIPNDVASVESYIEQLVQEIAGMTSSCHKEQYAFSSFGFGQVFTAFTDKWKI